MNRFHCLTKATATVAVISLAAAEDITFNRDIRPILADRCFACHGPDSATREAGLRLDQEESAKLFVDGSAAIIPGDLASSMMIERINETDPDLVMPPPDTGRALSVAEKQTLQKWITDGAKWEGHWAFTPPKRPQLPVTAALRKWPRNSIDFFIARKLNEAGLSPSPEADKQKWIRRVTFDLTGLPPTVEEVDAFLADETDRAHERVVDRLLKSPSYGEHMAASWLDAARYADTDGYQNDGPRTMFRYRDWVIDAFNANMPFDQFTIEQLAGDLLPNATLSQKIATGFNRNHRYNSEAGLVLEEFLLENAVDRVDTTSTVWMGLTLGCARCHDHKYDPFSQKEYYQLISFFDNITESGRAIKFGNSEPWIPAPTDSQSAELKKIDQQLLAARSELNATIIPVQKSLEETISYLRQLDIPNFDPDATAEIANGMTHRFRFEDMDAEGIEVEKGGPVLRSGLHGTSAAVGGNGILKLGDRGDVTCHGRSSVSFWLKPEQLKSGVILSRQKKSTTRPGFSVELRDGRLQFYIITRWIAGVGMVETVARLTADEWVHVTLTNDGSQRASGQQIWINGKLAKVTPIHNTNSNTGGTSKGGQLRIGGGVHGDLFKGQVDDLRFYNRTLFEDEIDLLADPNSISQILATNSAQRTDRMNKKLIRWILGASDGDELVAVENPDVKAAASVTKTYQQLRLKRTKLMDSFPTSMVMEERPTTRDTHLRLRGVYDSLGDVVNSESPSVLPPMPPKKQLNRHDFARWLVSGQHPLTARVTVNRYWQRYFGTGLVKTPEDFGSQGELPSHPELLDWLAVDFVASGWDVKAMQKQIVLSATYRQSSRHSPSDEAKRHEPTQTDDPHRDKPLPQSGTSTGTHAKTTKTAAGHRLPSDKAATPHHSESDGYIKAATLDPENRLLWRGPRIRLSARQLRDQALFASGLMSADIGGPSVSPYQPAKLWAEMSNMKYKQSKGKDLYRRGLYTIWKRTVAPPSLAILDAADRENCIVRPKRTNTPLQALALLNETTFVESARHLAMRMMTEGKDTPISFAFKVVTAREPSKNELAALTKAKATYLAEFRSDPAEADKLLSVGESKTSNDADPIELAANTMVCNVLLNLDEVVTKE